MTPRLNLNFRNELAFVFQVRVITHTDNTWASTLWSWGINADVLLTEGNVFVSFQTTRNRRLQPQGWGGGALTNNIYQLLFQLKLKPGFRFCPHNMFCGGASSRVARRSVHVHLVSGWVFPRCFLFLSGCVSPGHPLCAPHLNWCMPPYIPE